MMLKPLCGSQQTVENSLKDGNTKPPYLPWETCTQVNNEQLDMEQLESARFKLGKGMH